MKPWSASHPGSGLGLDIGASVMNASMEMETAVLLGLRDLARRYRTLQRPARA